MKHLSVAAAFLLMVSAASATTINSEEVSIDLQSSEVGVEVQVEDLTSESFSYFTSYPVQSFEARENGQEVSCSKEDGALGSEIVCDVSNTDSFNLTLEMKASGLSETGSGRESRFTYTKSFIRPTENFSLTATLPKGQVLVDQANSTSAPYSPSDAEVGSTGQRITVKWSSRPSLGDSQVYRAAYEPANGGTPRVLYVAAALAGLVVLLGGAYFGYMRFFRESIDEVYEELEDDQAEMLELIAENGGEMLQKDIVDRMEYSKAKISGMASDLVDEDILVKKKEGRSNKLSISRKYQS